MHECRKIYFLCFVGYTLAFVKNENLQVLTADALISLFTKKNHESRRYVSLEARIECAIQSQLLNILAQLIQLAEEKIYPNVLDIIKVLAKAADKACK